MCRVKKILIVCLCVVSSFVFALHSSVSYALDFSVDVDLVSNSPSQIYPLAWNCGASVCNGFQNAWTGFLTTTDGGLLTYRHSIPNRTYSYGDIIRLSYNLTASRDTSANHTSFAGLKYNGNHPVSVLYSDVSQLNDSGGIVYVYFWVYGTFTDSDLSLTSVDGGFTWYLYTGSSGSAESLKILDTQVFRLKNGSQDYSSALNTIQGGISDVNRNLNNVQNSIDQSNQDANDRYEDEKDTINDNGDNANSSWTDNADNLKFQPPTFLFNWFWSLGTTDQCIDISTLDSLIHSNETQYCSWYPNNIRSIISPIINIFLVCFISGFIIKWLKKDGI